MIPTHKELTDATKFPAFIHPDEVEFLCKYAMALSPLDQLVEIGCAWGGSTVLFLSYMPMNATLLSVDPFVQDSMDTWKASEDQCREAVLNGLHAFNRAYVFDDWNLCVETSVVAASHWHDEINLLYLDGDHTEQGVNADFAAWTPYLVSGGTLLLHDSRRLDGYPDDEFAQGWPAPTALANRLRTDAGWQLVDEVFSLTVWEKQ